VIAALFTQAHGGVPLVYDGPDPAALVAEAARLTGLTADQFTPQALDGLLTAPTVVVGDAVLRPCVRDLSTVSEVRADLARAEAAWLQSALPVAVDHLDLAVAHLGCLSEVVDRGVAARVFQLRAAVLAAHGSPDLAAVEARSAVSFAPETPWPLAFGDAGAAIDAEVRAVSPSVSLRIVPAGGPAGPWLDGELVGTGGQVRDALHLLQAGGVGGIRSSWLAVAGEATVVLPTAFRRPALDAIEREADRPALELLVLEVLPDVDAAYVSWAGGLWLVARTDLGPNTTRLAAPPNVEPISEKKRPKRR